MSKLETCAAIVGIAALSFWLHPGHTFLQNDTLIYVPPLEHAASPTVLSRDLLASISGFHLTLYDEVAIGLHRLTGLGFREVLSSTQFVFRALAVAGIFLIGRALAVPAGAALLICGIYSLGADAYGPNMETVELEPVPRSLAFPLLLAGLGFLGLERFRAAGAAFGAGFLLHPLTILPVLILIPAHWSTRRKTDRQASWKIVLPVIAAAAALIAVAAFQNPPRYSIRVLARMDPWWMSIQKQRLQYNWVSSYGIRGFIYYLVAFGISAAAFLRLPKSGKPVFRFFLAGLPVVGLASVPVSYLFYEKLGFAILGGVQPMRMLLWVQMTVLLLPAVAGVHACLKGRRLEGTGWLVLAFLPACHTSVFNLASKVWTDPLAQRKAAWVLVFALLCSATLLLRRRGRLWAGGVLGVVAVVLPFFSLRVLSVEISHEPVLQKPDVARLVEWARQNSPADSVFVFPDAGMNGYPTYFRASSNRAVYVDWKGAGPVAYYRAFAEEWWGRWEKWGAKPYQPSDCAGPDPREIDFVVLDPKHRITGAAPVHESATFVVYKTPLCGAARTTRA